MAFVNVYKWKAVDFDSAENLYAPVKYTLDGRTSTYRAKLDNGEILSFFGLKPGHPIHREFESAKWVGDTLVMIFAKGSDNHIKYKRRVVAMCNRCGVLVCAGHLDQHRGGYGRLRPCCDRVKAA